MRPDPFDALRRDLRWCTWSASLILVGVLVLLIQAFRCP